MTQLFFNARIFDSDTLEYRRGSLFVRDGRIEQVIGEGQPLPDADRRTPLGGRRIVPGLVDVHTHGRCGQDFNLADADGMRLMALSYASYGTTAIFPTLASDTPEGLCRSAKLITEVAGDTGGCRFAGIHLEGRYLNPSKRGAHNPELLRKPDPEEILRFLDASGLPVHISAALELDEGDRFADAAAGRGATLGLGHTCATYADACRLSEKYGISFTHLYNCMPGLHHRDGGPVLSALCGTGMAELICDGFHISPEMIAFTYSHTGRSRTVLVSDSMAATAFPDGSYLIAGTPAIVKDGIARTPEGNLAGSTLTLSRAVENLSRFCGISVEEALLCATRNPAREAGLEASVGILAAGAFADFLVLDDRCEGTSELGICAVFAGGKEIKPV